MSKTKLPEIELKLDKIVGGGQTIGTYSDGRKVFVWGGLPEEEVKVQITKKKSKLFEGYVTEVIKPAKNRVEPLDHDSYLSTSPWQIMDFASEQNYKSALINEAFKLHDIELQDKIKFFTDDKQYAYRNKIEFSWYWNKESEALDLAFFRRGTHGKIPVDGSSLAKPIINQVAIWLRDLIRKKTNIRASNLKTLLIRCNQDDHVSMQLYVNDPKFALFSEDEIKSLNIDGFEIIFSNPKSPASVITRKIQAWGDTTLTDIVLNTTFNYTVEGFFQINLPVYEQALKDMQKWVNDKKPTVDLYSGVGTIGLTIGGPNVTLVEINEPAVNEMKRNIKALKREKTAKAVLAPSENALEYISSNATIIIDPPRAGLHDDVVSKLLEITPKRVIYLSCNPVTQARDVAKLSKKYQIIYQQGYNFFPRTPHIENLIVLDAK